MNSMNYLLGHSNLRLCSRNEGQIKSYESCRDVRAWSHDVRERDRYLREWIKSDMPICVLPTGVLAKFMRTMTCKSRGRATPRCHPDCKSKVVLDSICNSCTAMKDCLKNEEDFEKYFEDEEFETSHWPCEKCLEALKNIKMFWKIIVEKIFNVNISKDDDVEQNQCCCAGSVRSVAKVWQNEMTQQALFLKNLPLPNHSSDFSKSRNWKGKKATAPCNYKPCDYEDLNCNNFTKSKVMADCRNSYVKKSCKDKTTDTDCLSNPMVSRSNRTCLSTISRKPSRSSIAKVKMVDEGCGCDEISKEIKAYKTNLAHLQKKCTCQKNKIETLKRENSSLKIELQNVYKNSSWKTAFFTPTKCASSHDTIAVLPKPFECCADENVDTNQVKGIDSEMIITMKNGKNEAYRHISLLQVLHKTNDPNIRELSLGNDCCNKKEDPIELLTKVQNTFGAIVKRELVIANKKKQREKICDVDVTFDKMNASKSALSCSTSNDSRCVNNK